MSIRPVRLVAAIGVLAALTACGQSGSAAPPAGDDDSIPVVASTNVWASVASAVGGNEVDVRAIVADPAGDPHSHRVSAKDAAQLRGAQLVVFNGGGYDDFVRQALGDGDDGRGPRLVEAFELRPDKAAENEHVWYDLPTVAMVAGEIAAQLSQLRPEAKAAFVANADAFDAKLDELEGKVSDLGTASGGRSAGATEPVAHYLLQAAKLTDATPEEFVEAIEEETDPPAAAVAQVQRLVSERRITVLVHNPQTETPVVTDLVAQAHAAGIPVVDMTETLPDGQDYLTWMGNQIKALSEALTSP